MEQLALFEVEVETRRELPCSNPDLVEGYLSIEKILQGDSGDWYDMCDECEMMLCEHRLDEKREDDSYMYLVDHFRNGGMIDQPICYDRYLRNGHHRLAAALDAGFTHIPYQSVWGDEDWDVPASYYFRLV